MTKPLCIRLGQHVEEFMAQRPVDDLGGWIAGAVDLLREAAEALTPRPWPPPDDDAVWAFVPGEGWGTDTREEAEAWAESGGLPAPTRWLPIPPDPEGGKP